MAYAQRDNSGSLHKNKEKEKETHPDYKGKIMVAGVEYWLSAWIKESDSGHKWMSLAVKPKEERAAPPPQKPAPKAGGFDDLQEIPF